MAAVSTPSVRPCPRPPFLEAQREMTSLLAPLERRCLTWLAERMPGRIHSDQLTLLALASLIGAGLCYALAPVTPVALAMVVFCLALNWFGDSLDGTLARVRRQPRPRYGFYVDHVVDTIGTAALLGGLALSGFMTPILALVLLSAYFMVCVEVFLAAHTVGTFTMSSFRVGPTELRILLASGTIALYWNPAPSVFGHAFRLFDLGGAVGAAGLVATFLVSAARHTRLLYEAEPIPPVSQVAS
jgi:archaetidylinositol phosphate synthase